MKGGTIPMKSVFGSINSDYQSAKRAIADHSLIVESVMDVDEVLPGSDEEMDDVTDVESVPEDVYKQVDNMLDKLVSDPNYDDTEVEELVDDDFDEGEVSDDVLNAMINETAGSWLEQ